VTTPTPEPVELLSAAEQHCLDLTVELWNTMVREVIGGERSSHGDRSELASKIHDIQHMIMSQAAARAYPRIFRLLGGSVATEETV
jgi:hypothetical protein